MLFKRTFKDKAGERRKVENWSYRFEYGGDIYQGSTRTANKKLAQTVEAKRRIEAVEKANGLAPKTDKPIPTLKEFSKDFLRYLDGKVARRTYISYDYTIDHCLRFEPLANARLDTINSKLIEDFVRWMREQYVAPAVKIGGEKVGAGKKYSDVTVNHALAALRRCLFVAVELDKLDKAPKFSLLKWPAAKDFVITEEMLSRLLDLCKARPDDVAWSAPRVSIAPQMAPLLTVLFDTGMRAGEAAALEWRDVKLDGRGSIHVRRGKTENAARFIPLTERAKAVLTDLKSRARGAFVFTRANYDHITVGWASHQMTWACRFLDLKGCSLHSTRHSYLTRLGEAGADAFTIMKLAGHATIQQSQRYVHPSEARMESTVALLDRKAPAVVTESVTSAARA